MRSGHCLKVWTKKQQGVSLSTAESEFFAAVKTASEGLGIQGLAKDLGIECKLNLHLDASATMCLVNRRDVGKAKHVSVQHLWIQEASKSETKKVGTHASPADLVTKPLPRPNSGQMMKLMGYRDKGQHPQQAGLRWCAHSNVQKETESWCPCRWLQHRKRHGPL